jgi:hypothetical protein
MMTVKHARGLCAANGIALAACLALVDAAFSPSKIAALGWADRGRDEAASRSSDCDGIRDLAAGFDAAG